MIEDLIKNEFDPVIRANLGAYLAEFSYLQNAHSETTTL